MVSDDPPLSIHAVRLGEELRQLRKGLSMTQQMAKARLRRSTSSISRIERGSVRLPERDLIPILDAYGVTDPTLRQRLLAFSREETPEVWWQKYEWDPDSLATSDTAGTKMRSFDLLYVPGMLQTWDYAYALFAGASSEPRGPHRLRQMTTFRMNRQVLLQGMTEFHFILYETALMTLVGGPEVMRTQLEHARHVVESGRARLQVVPFTAAPVSSTTSFTLFTTPATGDVVQSEIPWDTGWSSDESAVAFCSRAFASLTKAALTQDDSLSLLSQRIREL